MKTGRMVLLLTAIVGFCMASLAEARPGFGRLYYEGAVVRTVVPPAAMPNEGVDDLYAIMDGAEGQLPVIAVAPGRPGYHGGKWAFHSVTWNVAPYLVTSEAELLEAAGSGDVTINRVPGNDFKCPVQP